MSDYRFVVVASTAMPMIQKYFTRQIYQSKQLEAYYVYSFTGKVLCHKMTGKGLLWPYSFNESSNHNMIDNITLSYEGNQLNRIFDTSTTKPTYKDAMAFVDGADEAVEYTYDANGNMVADMNKGIEKITYNLMNLPYAYCANNPIRYIDLRGNSIS